MLRIVGRGLHLLCLRAAVLVTGGALLFAISSPAAAQIDYKGNVKALTLPPAAN